MIDVQCTCILLYDKNVTSLIEILGHTNLLQQVTDPLELCKGAAGLLNVNVYHSFHADAVPTWPAQEAAAVDRASGLWISGILMAQLWWTAPLEHCHITGETCVKMTLNTDYVLKCKYRYTCSFYAAKEGCIADMVCKLQALSLCPWCKKK